MSLLRRIRGQSLIAVVGSSALTRLTCPFQHARIWMLITASNHKQIHADSMISLALALAKATAAKTQTLVIVAQPIHPF